MIKFKKGYKLKIVFIGVSILLFFNLSFHSYAFSQETLRVPSSFKYNAQRFELALYFQERFLFKDEEDLKVMLRSCVPANVVENIPREPKNFLYRAMRLAPKSAVKIPLEGLQVLKTAYGKIYFVVSPFVAAKCAFFPLSRRNNYPEEDFMSVVIQIDRKKIPHLTTVNDVSPDDILKIFVFDKLQKTFVDRTNLFTSLSSSSPDRNVTIRAQVGKKNGYLGGFHVAPMKSVTKSLLHYNTIIDRRLGPGFNIEVSIRKIESDSEEEWTLLSDLPLDLLMNGFEKNDEVEIEVEQRGNLPRYILELIIQTIKRVFEDEDYYQKDGHLESYHSLRDMLLEFKEQQAKLPLAETLIAPKDAPEELTERARSILREEKEVLGFLGVKRPQIKSIRYEIEKKESHHWGYVLKLILHTETGQITFYAKLRHSDPAENPTTLEYKMTLTSSQASPSTPSTIIADTLLIRGIENLGFDSEEPYNGISLKELQLPENSEWVDLFLENETYFVREIGRAYGTLNKIAGISQFDVRPSHIFITKDMRVYLIDFTTQLGKDIMSSKWGEAHPKAIDIDHVIERGFPDLVSCLHSELVANQMLGEYARWLLEGYDEIKEAKTFLIDLIDGQTVTHETDNKATFAHGITRKDVDALDKPIEIPMPAALQTQEIINRPILQEIIMPSAIKEAIIESIGKYTGRVLRPTLLASCLHELCHNACKHGIGVISTKGYLYELQGDNEESSWMLEVIISQEGLIKPESREEEKLGGWEIIRETAGKFQELGKNGIEYLINKAQREEDHLVSGRGFYYIGKLMNQTSVRVEYKRIGPGLKGLETHILIKLNPLFEKTHNKRNIEALRENI